MADFSAREIEIFSRAAGVWVWNEPIQYQ